MKVRQARHSKLKKGRIRYSTLLYIQLLFFAIVRLYLAFSAFGAE